MTKRHQDTYKHDSVSIAEDILTILQLLNYSPEGYVTDYDALRWNSKDDTYDVATIGGKRVQIPHRSRLEFEFLISMLNPPSPKVYALKKALAATVPWFKSRSTVSIGPSPAVRGASPPPEAVALQNLSQGPGAGMAITHYYIAMAITTILQATGASQFIQQNWRSPEPFEVKLLPW